MNTAYPDQAAKDRIWFRPPAALGIGLLAFPLGKLLWIPNYVFNFGCRASIAPG